MTAMRPAREQADLVKGQGSHVFALGVGAAVTKPSSASRLTAVSGFDQVAANALSRGPTTRWSRTSTISPRRCARSRRSSVRPR